MKKLITFTALLLSTFFFAQNIKMDTLTGTNGIFKRFKPKEIVPNQNLHFDLKISFSGKDKSGKDKSGNILMNTRNGYFGLLKSGTEFNPNASDFNFLVYSNFLKNYVFKNDKKGRKTVMSLPFNPEINKQEINIKKGTQPVKTFTAMNLRGYPYFNEKSKNGTLYLSEDNLNTKTKTGNQIIFGGIGFHEINGKTALCLMIDGGNFSFKVDKIEAVNLNLDTSVFKKNAEVEGMQEKLQEMMKKYKKN